MDDRLRNWAATGRYTDPEDPYLDGPLSHRRRHSDWRETSLLALLVPAGVVVGSLLAVACMGRFIALPFVRRKGSR
jgi:hypothetical protein